MDYLREVEISQAVERSLAGDVAKDDPWGHAQLEIIRRLCVAFEDAMRLEGVPRETRDRVRSTVLLGDPEGIEDLHRRELEMLQSVILSAPPREIYFNPYSFPFHPDEPLNLPPLKGPTNA